MSSGLDLSLAPDSRFMKFRENYTTGEHLMSLYEAQRATAAINAIGFDQVSRGLGQVSQGIGALGDGIADVQWAVEEGFSQMAQASQQLQQSVENGFMGMQEAFDWGIARLCWEHEQDRQVYHQILDVLRHPLTAQGLELRERAEKAVANKWWEDAVSDLTDAISNNRYDYLAHLQLAQVLFFRFGQSDPAMEQFQLAAKYADTVKANDAERYYAAIAYCHASLLWRLDADKSVGDKTEPLRSALAAGERAAHLAPTLALALQEQVLCYLLLGLPSDAQAAMRGALTANEGLILTLETCPELRDWPVVGDVCQEWRESWARRTQWLTDLLDEIIAAVPSIDAAAARNLVAQARASIVQKGTLPTQHRRHAVEAVDRLLALAQADAARRTPEVAKRALASAERAIVDGEALLHRRWSENEKASAAPSLGQRLSSLFGGQNPSAAIGSPAQARMALEDAKVSLNQARAHVQTLRKDPEAGLREHRAYEASLRRFRDRISRMQDGAQ